MHKRLLSSSVIVTLVALISLTLSSAAFAATPASAQAKAVNFKTACGQAARGHARCLSLISTTTVAAPEIVRTLHNNLFNGAAVKPQANPPGESAPYQPSDLLNAYNLSGLAPNSQTVAIVDAQNDPNAESDMNVYRSTFGISSCTTSNGCFRKVNQTGGTSYPAADVGWAEEISLDLDMVSAICENCNILLVEANSSSFSDLGTAVNEAVRLGANEISNSYGGSQSSGDVSTCNSYYTHSGIAVTASSGDQGQIVEAPADCPHVVAIGGTTLNSNGSETPWHTSSTEGAGGGCSTYISKPTWETQSVTGCSRRAVSDVSAVADPNTGVYVYDTYGQSGWLEFGGTSVSSPIIASVYALAGGISGDAASYPWSRYTSGCLFKVNGKTYNYQSGLGSPNGTGCF